MGLLTCVCIQFAGGYACYGRIVCYGCGMGWDRKDGLEWNLGRNGIVLEIGKGIEVVVQGLEGR